MRKELAIETVDLTIGYNGMPVIENINLRVEEGDFYGLIGPNGGGKTTLLRGILGLLRPIRGEVRVFGKGPRVGRRYIGYVPQFAIYDRDFPISVKEVVLMGRRPRRGSRPFYSEEDRKAAEEAMEQMRILHLRDTRLSELSGGQRQRAYVARALASKPRILLLDEPTASIDPQTSLGTYDLLKKLNDEITIVVVTHDIGVISSYVSKVGCLNRHLFTHEDRFITRDMLEKSYTCPVDLVAHGLPHRVLAEHEEEE